MNKLYNNSLTNPPQIAATPCASPVKAGGYTGWQSSCLFSNNSIENAITPPSSPLESSLPAEKVQLSSYHKKQAQTLYSNVNRLVTIESKSINHVAFLTLTFRENITDAKEAYARFRSFNSNFLSTHPVYGNWVSVKEHQARGAWHFHMIIQLNEDIRTGFDFDQFDEWLKGPRRKGTFPTGNNILRSLWAELNEVLPGYGFGKIFTLEPIKSNAEAVSRYVGKYVSKQIGQRSESDKGVRLINYSKGWLKNSVNLAWYNDNSKLWREKVALFARLNGCQEMYQLSEKLGSDWAYRYTQEIVELPWVPKRHLDLAFGPEEIYENKMIPEMEEKSAVRIAAGWNKVAIKNFEWKDKERQKIVAQKVGARLADSSRNKKNQKSRVKVQGLINEGCKKWLVPEMTAFFRKEAQEEIDNLELTCAKQDKDAWLRKQQALEQIKEMDVDFQSKPDITPF